MGKFLIQRRNSAWRSDHASLFYGQLSLGNFCGWKSTTFPRLTRDGVTWFFLRGNFCSPDRRPSSDNMACVEDKKLQQLWAKLSLGTAFPWDLQTVGIHFFLLSHFLLCATFNCAKMSCNLLPLSPLRLGWIARVPWDVNLEIEDGPRCGNEINKKTYLPNDIFGGRMDEDVELDCRKAPFGR